MEAITIKDTGQKKSKKPLALVPINEEYLLDKLPTTSLEKGVKKKVYTYQQYDELMQTKKNRHAADSSNSKLFFAIGLVLSMAFVVMAFEWKTYDNGDGVTLQDMDVKSFDEIIDIPNTIQPPPPLPEKIIAPVFKEVANEVILETIKVNLDVEMNENTIVESIDYSSVVELEEEKAEEIFTIVEQRPEPVGGLAAFYTYVAENLDYPAQATRMNIQGKVYVRFVVEKNGAITDVEVLKGIGGGCDEEAVHVIKNSPKWIPGKQRGNPVRVYMSVPIIFTLM